MLEKTKCYVLDTSDLVANHEAPFMFGEHRVVVPAICLDELDDLTHRGGHVGTSAQASSRFFDQLREKGNLAEGLPTPGGGIVSVDLNGDTNNRLPRGYDLKKHDHIIINTAIRLQESHPDWRVILVSKDVNMRVKASLKLIAQDFESEKVKTVESMQKDSKRKSAKQEADAHFLPIYRDYFSGRTIIPQQN